MFADLFGCNRSVPYRGLLFIVCLLLIHIFIPLHPSVSVSIRVLCVEGPCPCVSPVGRSRFSFSLLLFGTRPPWSRLFSPRTRVLSRQRPGQQLAPPALLGSARVPQRAPTPAPARHVCAPCSATFALAIAIITSTLSWKLKSYNSREEY